MLQVGGCTVLSFLIHRLFFGSISKLSRHVTHLQLIFEMVQPLPGLYLGCLCGRECWIRRIGRLKLRLNPPFSPIWHPEKIGSWEISRIVSRDSISISRTYYFSCISTTQFSDSPDFSSKSIIFSDLKFILTL